MWTEQLQGDFFLSSLTGEFDSLSQCIFSAIETHVKHCSSLLSLNALLIIKTSVKQACLGVLLDVKPSTCYKV